jgi:hypothetical protein
MLQFLVAALFSLIMFGGLSLVVGTLLTNRDRIVDALANRGEAVDPGFVWVARVKRVSRPAPALSRSRPQLVRAAA